MKGLTIVDHLELADEIQPYLAEVILEQLEEQREEVFRSRIPAKQRGKAGDLRSQSGTDMLARVGRKIPDAWQDPCKDDFPIDKLGKA